MTRTALLFLRAAAMIWAMTLAWIAALVLLAAEPVEPACFPKAKELLAKVEKVGMHRRLAAIDLSIRRDPSIICDVVDRKFFQKAVERPAGCTEKSCAFPQGIEVAPKLIEDAGFELYVRVQTIATKLRAAKLLSPAHERLLSTMLLSAALDKEAH